MYVRTYHSFPTHAHTHTHSHAYTHTIHNYMQDINELTNSIYIPKGINVKSLSTEVDWPFVPSKNFKVTSQFELSKTSERSPCYKIGQMMNSC